MFEVLNGKFLVFSANEIAVWFLLIGILGYLLGIGIAYLITRLNDISKLREEYMMSLDEKELRKYNQFLEKQKRL